MATSASERLRRLLSLFSREDRLMILINADPDAMASAMALKRLLWRKISNTSIAHVNVISRPDNQVEPFANCKGESPGIYTFCHN
ncbi:MAG: hypothetical protein JRF28_06545 [Deltaproteobacteria bacterium]|nr:hypothetical protein [Deltaproteobacteria bacterium]